MRPQTSEAFLDYLKPSQLPAANDCMTPGDATPSQALLNSRPIDCEHNKVVFVLNQKVWGSLLYIIDTQNIHLHALPK